MTVNRMLLLSRVFAQVCVCTCTCVLVTNLAWASPRTGYILVDANTGQRLSGRAENEPFMAASTLKLATALAALDILGPNHQFETSLSITGKRTGNALDGDVVLTGDGDVELDLDELMRMALALRSSGITKVTGRFLVEDDAFIRTDYINPEQPLDAPYNAGIGPLSLAFGRATLRLDVDGNYYSNPKVEERSPAWRLAESSDERRNRAIPIQDVGLHAARSLHRIASELGIALPTPMRGTTDRERTTLSTIKSKPLAEMVKGMMIYSNNQLAETIGLAATRALNLQSRSLSASAAGLWQHFSALLPRSDWNGLQLTNHSGLDPNAQATPAQLAVLLQYGLDQHALPSLLPANAWSGSLGRRLVEPGRLQRVWAKTGSIDFAVALAGYVLPEHGGLWIFAIITDDPERRAAYDQLPEPTEAIRKEAQAWERDVKAQHDVLLRQWISGQH